MGKITFYLFFLFTGITLYGQSNYYWYDGQKIFLEELNTKRFILFNPTENISNLKASLNIDNLNVEKSSKMNVFSSLAPYKKSEIENYNWAILKGDFSEGLINHKEIVYEASFFLTPEKIQAGLSNLFYVKLKDQQDIKILEEMASINNVEILGNNKFMPLWYTLSCSKISTGNALEMANYFYESGRYAASQPDLMTDDSPLCVNDSHFSNQWNLDNTGQHGGVNGIDINYCEATEITSGDQNVIVAVLDQGVELNHPDLTNIHPVSFDTETGTSPSQVLGDHGTACAGIIGANTNNSDGIAGIAPESPIMSISNSLAGTPNSRQRRADGINFAVNNGASVINNSWSSAIQYQIIDDAITNAFNNGRDGLGCVVVFSSGNDNGAVNYPANSNEDILVVGAMSPCGERKNPGSCDGENFWGGNFGNQLDISAPGVLIPTTDRQGVNGYNHSAGVAGNFTQDFNGTSAAGPHVAAVAALVLSINPNLTFEEVNDIIESTAQKVGGYNYANNINRPNGTWNNEMGYGLVDAYAAALQTAANIDGPDTFCSSETYNLIDIPLGLDIEWEASGQISIPQNSSGYSIVATAAGNGDGTLTAVITNPNNGGDILITKNVTVGYPSITAEGYYYNSSPTYPLNPYISIYNNPINEIPASVTAEFSFDGATSSHAEIISQSDFSITWGEASGPSNASFYFDFYGVDPVNPQQQWIVWRVTAESPCGTETFDVAFYSEVNNYSYAYYPNPANSEITIENTSFNKSKQFYNSSNRTNDAKGTIIIYDFNGAVVQMEEYDLNSKSFRLDVSSVKPGKYFMKIGAAREEETHQIVIRR